MSAAPLGLNKCVSIINPGLAPWAMQECRPKGLFADEPNRLFVASCRIYWVMSVFRLLLDLLGRCRCFVCCRIYWAMSLFRLLSDLLGDVGVYTCCWIYWSMSVVRLLLDLLGRCRWLHLLLDLLGGCRCFVCCWIYWAMLA